MTFVDTNYFLRLLRDDVPEQTARVKSFFQQALRNKEELFTSTVVLFEVNWVLLSSYKSTRETVNTALQKLINIEGLEIEERFLWQSALILHKKRPSLSLEDCYNLTYARIRDAKAFKTFDKKLARAFAEK